MIQSILLAHELNLNAKLARQVEQQVLNCHSRVQSFLPTFFFFFFFFVFVPTWNCVENGKGKKGLNNGHKGDEEETKKKRVEDDFVVGMSLPGEKKKKGRRRRGKGKKGKGSGSGAKESIKLAFEIDDDVTNRDD